VGALGIAWLAIEGCTSQETPADAGATGGRQSTTVPDGSVAPTAECQARGGGAAVQRPEFLRNIRTGETGWFSSPAVVDLDGDGSPEIVAPCYSTFVYSATGERLGVGTDSDGRVYAPGVVADL